MQLADDLHEASLDAALELHRVVSSRDELHALGEDRLSENGRRGGTVTRLVGGLAGDLH